MQKLLKMVPPVALGRISPEQFTARIMKFYMHLLGTVGLTNLPDMTSLAVSGRLQNAIQHYTKVRKTDPASKESNNSTTV